MYGMYAYDTHVYILYVWYVCLGHTYVYFICVWYVCL